MMWPVQLNFAVGNLALLCLQVSSVSCELSYLPSAL